MPSQFNRTLPRPASSPSTYSTSPSSSPAPFGMTSPQNQEQEQGNPLPFSSFSSFSSVHSLPSLFHTSDFFFIHPSFVLNLSPFSEQLILLATWQTLHFGSPLFSFLPLLIKVVNFTVHYPAPFVSVIASTIKLHTSSTLYM